MSDLSPEQREALAYALYEYPLGSPQLEDAIRRLSPVVETLLAAEREAGAAEVRARVEAVCARHEHGALRWADPLPVPEWIAELRAALNGGE